MLILAACQLIAVEMTVYTRGAQPVALGGKLCGLTRIFKGNPPQKKIFSLT